MIKGVMRVLEDVDEGTIAIAFLSRGPQEWHLIFEKVRRSARVRLHQLVDLEVEDSLTGTYDRKVEQRMVFLWEGRTEELIHTVNLMY